MSDDVIRLFEVEKKLEKGKEPQPTYLQYLRHDSHKWLVSAQLEVKRNATLGCTWMQRIVTEDNLTEERMSSLAQVSLSVKYSNVTVKNHAEPGK